MWEYIEFVVKNPHVWICVCVSVRGCMIESMLACCLPRLPSPALTSCVCGCQCVSLYMCAMVVCRESVAAATENHHSNSTSSRRPQPLSREQSLTQSNLLSRVRVCVYVVVLVCKITYVCVCVFVFLCGCVQVKERRNWSSTSGKRKGERRASEIRNREREGAVNV